ncbi:adenosylcobalamin-dependent ribonucleoside-diphosphate reductase [Achromobacter sp. Bel]|uniref:adenosylcobalamin-dependent ribonucleoside-diphosphate reductase n=1 Tax=Achromobacter sp. Bel TaxID=2727415 RepID=UPI00145F2C1D|nr:adenosylcobalamin-dependent ribonucleoside-diphosphate reductase [Achromobacter sp. Bel]NMK46466.1 adenosylcobalamin-dependent ribonucleoside-diphosphate reductase [Achromobacter sp. Bel]
MLDQQRICAHVMADRYAAPGEATASQIYARVAHALAKAEAPERRTLIAQEFLRNMEMGAIGAGRIMANAGTSAHATMINCFVQPVGVGSPTLPFDSGLEQACTTLAMGGGVGYDFSALPPSSASAEAKAATPAVCSAIDRYDAACRSLSFQGSRRGAQMAVLSCNHPDILDFIRAKHGRNRWRTFNISVAITDAFLVAVQQDDAWPLVHPALPDERSISMGALKLSNGLWQYRREPARSLWATMAEEATHSSEPGFLYIDTINRANNLRAIETLRATNPCGEQPLPEYGCCVLGPINLTRLVNHSFGIGGEPEIDMEKLGKMVRTQVRMLDDVIELTRWPLPAQAKEAFSKRRIGVGITGLADMLAMLQLHYASEAGRLAARSVACCIRDNAYAASAELAAERAPFPLYRADDYLAAGAIGDFLPPDVVKAIKAHGLRNSHLVSFAPTGSVSLAFADGCSSGIEPAFDWVYRRQIQLPGAIAVDMTVENHAWRLWKQSHASDLPLPGYFQKSADIAPEDHLAMLAALQPYVDASISKTIPVPGDYRPERAQALFIQAWKMGLKGVTIFRPDRRLAAVINPSFRARPSARITQGCGTCG